MSPVARLLLACGPTHGQEQLACESNRTRCERRWTAGISRGKVRAPCGHVCLVCFRLVARVGDTRTLKNAVWLSVMRLCTSSGDSRDPSDLPVAQYSHSHLRYTPQMVALCTAMCVYFPSFTLLPCACLEIALFRPLDQSVCRRPMDLARDFCSGPASSAYSARAVECAIVQASISAATLGPEPTGKVHRRCISTFRDAFVSPPRATSL